MIVTDNQPLPVVSDVGTILSKAEERLKEKENPATGASRKKQAAAYRTQDGNILLQPC